MEMRTGALFLLLLVVSAVCASPHGYGVKGGAAAKAEARAVAGAYGGEIPVPIQPGSAFSGSFSKSSASSFASSSASSSASSYSFSGSAPSGFDHKDLSHGGCATGSCQNNADKTSPHYGSAPNSQSGASAGAFAGAGARSINFPKLNGNCGDKGCSKDYASPCSGEECSENIKKCTSGKCNSLDDGSNEITTNTAKSSETKDSSASECVSGNCGSTIPHHAGSESTNVYSSSAGTTVSPPYSNPPSTYLATPKEPCDSPNCDSSKVSPPSSYNVPLGSISAKPCAYGNCDMPGSSTPAFPVSNQYLSPGCSTPDCAVKPPTNYLQVPNYSDESSDCGSSGTCGTSKSDRYDIGPITQTAKTPSSSYASPNTKYPSEPESPSSYSPTGPHIPFAPKTPQMSFVSSPVTDSNPSFVALNGPNVHAYHNQPTPGPHFSSSSNAFGQSIPHRPSYAPVSTNIPHFASSHPMGTFSSVPSAVPTGPGYVHSPLGSGCGPSGCGASPTSYPGSFHTAPSYRPDQLPCKTPGCNMQTFHGAQRPIKPDYDSEKRPQYSGGFGGPPGLLKPNEFTGPSNVPFSSQKPPLGVSLPSPSPGYGNTPSVGCAHGNCNTYPGHGQNAGSPVQCQSGNCNSNQAQFGSGTSGGHADNGNHIPGPGVSFGGPPGLLKPNEFTVPSNVPFSSQKPPLGVTLTSPSPGYGNTPSVGCAHGNCNTYPGHGPNADSPVQCQSGNCNNNQGQFGSGTSGGHANNGNHIPGPGVSFGGPPGLLKPNEFTVPSNVPFSSQKPPFGVSLTSPSPGYGNTPSVGCAHGNCNTYPSHGQNAGSPVQCQSGNCNNNQGQFGSGTIGGHADNGNHIPGPGVDASNCASGNCNQQHNHNGVAAGSHTSVHGAIGAAPSPCAAGNCNQAPNYNGFSSGSTNPGYGGIVGSPAQCKSGNCIQAPHNNGQATGSNNPGYGAAVGNPAHCASGNCHQHSNSNIAATGSNIPGQDGIVGSPAHCTLGNCNQSPSSNGGASGSAAVSAASASAGAYAGGFGGPPGLLKPHDHGKLEGKDAAGKLLSSLASGDQYSADLSNNANAESRGDDGSETLNGDVHGNNAHEGSKHSGCNGGCGGNGGAAASAKAYAGASSVAGAKGYGGSFAGSSASAHASSGAHTKGGYAGR